MMMKISH